MLFLVFVGPYSRGLNNKSVVPEGREAEARPGETMRRGNCVSFCTIRDFISRIHSSSLGRFQSSNVGLRINQLLESHLKLLVFATIVLTV